MKRKIHKLLSSAKQGLLALALTVFSGTAYSQTTINVNYTGAMQTVTVPAGIWGIQCWGATGGSIISVGGGGIGGYSKGELNVVSTTTLYVFVGGRGVAASGLLGPNAGAGGWNGGGGGTMIGVSGSGGGGGTDVRVGGIASTNRIIVAGGGGGAAGYYTATPNGQIAAGGNGGGVVAANGNTITSGAVITIGGGGQGASGATPGVASVGGSSNGTATGGGGGANSAGGASVGGQGTGGGAGGAAGQSGGGSTGCAAGGGGGYAGGAGGVQTNNGGAAGGGGSGYVGGVTNGTTVASGQPSFVANPDLSGNGKVIITELCDISLVAAGNTNSLNPMICSGQSLTLTTNAISNYSWSTGATTSSLVVAPTTNTVYSLSATSPSNCTTSRTISVSVNSALPVLSISNPSNNICLGRTISLSASGALTYTWTNPGIVNGQTFTPSSTAVYTVSGQNGCGITVGTTTITVAPLPVSTAVSPTLVCEGYAATLSAVSAVSGYTWQPGPLFGSSPITAVMVNTIYTVTASDGTCSGTGTVSLFTKPTPTITAATTSTLICEGESVTLTANGAGTGGSYNWTPGGAGSQITMSPVTSSLFAVAGTNSVNCTAGAQAVVVVVAAPPMSVVANKTLVCIQSSAILTASGANSYTWTNGPFVGTYTVTPTTAMTIYTVIGSHQTNTCLATRTIAVSALIPNVTVTSTTGICEGASATLTASGANTYSWNGINNGASGVFQPTPPVTTVYTLVAFTNSANVSCPSLHTATVIVYLTPTIAVTPAKQTICKGETHTLTASGAVNYSWSPTGTGSVITVKPNSTTSYQVTGVDANGCENTFLYTAKVSSCIGIAEAPSQHALSVYPNPSTGEFVITTTSDIIVKVVNSIGQEIRTLNLNATNDHSAQIKDLSSGVYFIVGENAEGKVNQKIIITK